MVDFLGELSVKVDDLDVVFFHTRCCRPMYSHRWCSIPENNEYEPSIKGPRLMLGNYVPLEQPGSYWNKSSAFVTCGGRTHTQR